MVRVGVDQLQPAVDIPGPVKTVTIIVTARVVGTTPNGLTILDARDLTYTSLPGANGTAANCTGSNTPGASGASTGERNGSGGVNDYVDSSSASVTLTTPTVQRAGGAHAGNLHDRRGSDLRHPRDAARGRDTGSDRERHAASRPGLCRP